MKDCDPWIKLSASEGVVDEQQHVVVSIDWNKAPKGCFIEENGYVSIPGGEFSEKVERKVSRSLRSMVLDMMAAACN